MRRQRAIGEKSGGMVMFLAHEQPTACPILGPEKGTENILEQHLVFSRDGEKEYVQDRMMKEEDRVAEMLNDPNTHIYICGLRGMEEGVISP